MTKILTFLFVILSWACAAQILPFDIKKTPFEIALQIDKVDNNQYYLNASIELEDGSYVVSPYSKDSVYMPFNLLINDQEYFIVEDSLLEIPGSVEAFDPILEMPVKFVKVNTTYKQKLKVLTQDDFEVSGRVELLIEPSCIPYQLDFDMSYESGMMKIKNANLKIHASYKGR